MKQLIRAFIFSRLLQCHPEWSAAVYHSSTTASAERRRTSTHGVVAAWPCALRSEGASLVTRGVQNQVQAGSDDVHNLHSTVPRLSLQFCTGVQ